METHVLIGILAIVLALGSGGALLYFYISPRQQTNMRSLMGNAGVSGLGTPSEVRMRLKEDQTGKEFEKLKNSTKRRGKGKVTFTIEERFFHAGIFSDEEKRDFGRLRILAPIIMVPVGAFVGSYVGGVQFILLGLVMGVLLGMQLPFSLLERRIKRRSDDIMFFLPLVIEQIVIGVSSSLDIGPCIQRVVQMADERDSHNAVTELFRHTQHYVKSGVALEEALNEIGRLSGHTELKHAFMSLSQVARHGGEITRQLQELADAVSGQRETKIEAKIKKLELEATGPVGLVFCGFLVILLIGFGTQVMKAFGN